MIMNKQEQNPSPLGFPCDFPIKVIGKANTSFEQAITAILEKHCPKFTGNIHRRPSRDGNYLALTFTITAKNKAQLDKIYSDITACTQVVMAL